MDNSSAENSVPPKETQTSVPIGLPPPVATVKTPVTAGAPKKNGMKFPVWGSIGVLALVAVGVATTFLLRGAIPDGGLTGGTASTFDLPIPTLDLQAMETSTEGSNLTARLVGSQGGVEIHSFTADEARAGFNAPRNKHVIFTCPADTTPVLAVGVAHGDLYEEATVRRWGYEYSGQESANKAAGKTGLQLFNGRFWLGAAELAATGTQYSYLHTANMKMVGGKTYYFMSDGAVDGTVRISCLDTDNDNLNNGREDLNSNGIVDAGETKKNDADSDDDGIYDGVEIAGYIVGSIPFITDPTKVDTDGDGVQDGTEFGFTQTSVVPPTDTNASIFIADADSSTKTDPTNADTDSGGEPDGMEDGNHNGKVDAGERDPLNPADDIQCGSKTITGSEECDDGKQCLNATSQLVDCTTSTSACADPATCGPKDDDGCSASCQLEVYDVTISGRLIDAVTQEPVEGASVISAYEFSPAGAVTAADGTFSFTVSTDFIITEGAGAGTSASGGTWNLEKNCYGQSPGLSLVINGVPGMNLEFRKGFFDAEEISEEALGLTVIDAGDVPIYPAATIHTVTDVPMGFDVLFSYKNLTGFNGPGNETLLTEHTLAGAMPLDYDAKIRFTDAAQAAHDSSTYRVPMGARCGTATLKYEGGISTWSYCADGIIEDDETCDDSNIAIDDGCSALCQVESGWQCTGTPSVCTPILPELSEHKLDITVLANGTSDTAVENQKGIELLVFDARAATGLLLTGATFTAAEGDLTNGSGYSLKVDSDGDDIVDQMLQDHVAAVGGKVTFDTLAGGGYPIPGGDTVRFAVFVDVADTLATDPKLRLAFATTDTAPYITAETLLDATSLSGIRTDGTCTALCEMSVLTTNSKLWNFVPQGNLLVYYTGPQDPSSQILAGEDWPNVLHLTFEAKNEDIDVTSIVITNSAINPSITGFDLIGGNPVTILAQATNANCGAGGMAQEYCAVMESQQLVVPKGQTVHIPAAVVLKNDVNGAVPGSIVEAQILNVDDIQARGAASTNVLAVNDGDSIAEGEVLIGSTGPAVHGAIAGNQHDVVFASIGGIANGSADTDGMPVPLGTDKSIGAFTFTAETNANSKDNLNSMTFDKIIFSVASSNVTFEQDDFKLMDAANPQESQSCTPIRLDGTPFIGEASGAFLVECIGLGTAAIDTDIASGGSETLTLVANVANNRVITGSPSSLQVSLQSFNSRAMTTFGFDQSHMQWTDTIGEVPQADYTWLDYPDATINSVLYTLN